MKIHCQQIAERLESAHANFVANLMDFGKILKEDAEKVLGIYRKMKVIKTDVWAGVISVKHGAFLERDVIANTLELAKQEAAK